MWWDRSRPVEVYLGRRLVGCKGLDDAGARWAPTDGSAEGLAQLVRWAEAAGGRVRARVWLGSSFTRPWMLPADCGARDAREAAALARAQAAAQTGWGDVGKVWVARWRAGRPTLAVAVARTAWAAVEPQVSSSLSPSSRRALRIDSVRPWWNQVLDATIARSRREEGAIGWSVAESDGIVFGLLRRGELVELDFAASKPNDPGWEHLCRRLRVEWHEAGAVEHRFFAATEGLDGAMSIGHAVPRAVEDAA